MSEAAVLLLIFNRPDTTTQVMQAIRAARPPRLYVAADGPREGRGEAERCAEARRIATAVDWPCDVKTLFRDTNLGCRDGVSGGISWFFSHETEGIVLEDDCVPSQSFFPFCASLLERYRDEERIMCITGDNFQDDMSGYPYSYHFSKYNHCWGWASWRRAWRHYDFDMSQFETFMRSGALHRMSETPGFAKYWRRRFGSVKSRELDSWAYPWLFSCWVRGGITSTPRVNLVTNIGFGPGAAHTTDVEHPSANLPAGDLTFPLKHPPSLTVEEQLDRYVDVAHYGIKPPSTNLRWQRRVENAAKRLLRSAGLLQR